MKNNTNLLRGLHYFEAVARTGSVRLAAQALGVTDSAVSRQLRELTGALGEQLVVRAGRGIALTAKGSELAEKLRSTFDDLEATVLSVVGGGRRVLRLAVCTSFGPGWLAQHVGEFVAAHPDIDLETRLYAAHQGQTDQTADAIVTAQPASAGFASVRLFDEHLVAIAASGGEGDPDARLITTEPIGSEGVDWKDFAAATGFPSGDIEARSMLRTTHYAMAVALAKSGAGTALVPDFLAERDIAAGTLALATPHRAPSGRVYRLCFKERRAAEPAIAALARWLKAKSATQDRNAAAVPSGK